MQPASDPETIAKPDRASGLTSKDASLRLEADGPNELYVPEGRGWVRLLLGQFTDVMILVLLGAAAVAALAGEVRDGAIILAILLINAAIGFTQEMRARKEASALQDMAVPFATVIRDGTVQKIDARDVVVGDAALLQAGDKVPADIRLNECADLQIEEAALTGESVATLKDPKCAVSSDSALGDQRGMAFSGTFVVTGRGRGTVTATGPKSEIGQIASMVREDPTQKTPLQRRLARFSKRLAAFAVLVCAGVFAAGYLAGYPPLITFMTAASVAVASMPESFPAVVTILLALGARTMARSNALVTQLSAVETLGSVTQICTDKTGTLTKNEMTVQDVLAVNQEQLLNAMCLSNDVERNAEGKLEGEATEKALFEYAANQGAVRSELDKRMPRIHEFGFTSERKYMTTVHQCDTGIRLYAKGAPEVLLVHSPELKDQAKQLAGQGLRMLAFLMKDCRSVPTDDPIDESWTPIGLACLIDPPRDAVPSAIATCQAAGITPVMITGDHPSTAAAIAQQIGLAQPNDGAKVVTGSDLKTYTEQDKTDAILSARIFARVDPIQKIEIVETLQDNGHFVAMTGDGVNDAPALAKADIGIAMGKGGTDVARQASDMILLDDNFASIVAAVREGRRIVDNIQKYIRYVLACNLAEVLIILLAPLMGAPLPLLPVQILWINLVTDGLPGLALAAERAEPGLMERAPRAPNASLLTGPITASIILLAVVMTATALWVQADGIRQASGSWQTMVFTVVTFMQLGQAFAVRSTYVSAFSLRQPANWYLVGAIALTVLVHLGVVYSPLGNDLLYTVPLTLPQLGLCTALSCAGLVTIEAMKFLRAIKSPRRFA